MKERVTVRFGTSNVVFVVPHGHDLDDTNTGILALAAANALDAHAIINNDWKRAKKVDEIKGEANCNDITHCKEPVVKAEFLDPIMAAIDETAGLDSSTYSEDPEDVYVFMIHGIGNSVRKKAKDDDLGLIVGFGAGTKPAYTCEEWRRDCFIDLCRANFGSFHTYEGAPGGAYSARMKTNLTQAIHRETGQHVLQLEFIHAMRHNDCEAITTGKNLAAIIKGLLKYTSYIRPAETSEPWQI